MTVPALTSSIISAKFYGYVIAEKTYIANIHSSQSPTITSMPAIISVDQKIIAKSWFLNCAPYDITFERNDLMGLIEMEEDKLIPLTDDIISSICASIHLKLPKIQKSCLTREDIACQCHLQVPAEYREKYIDILFKHQEAISIDKYDLGLAKDYQY